MNESKEIWKDIEGYELSYMVSNHGRVLSKERKCQTHFGERIVPQKMMKQRVDKTGYWVVSLCKGGKPKTMKVHRLVAGAFVDNPNKKPQVNHIDGNKRNNYVENLEWCTSSENQQHAFRIGLNYHRESAGWQKVPVRQIDLETGAVVNEFKSISEASEKTKIYLTTISRVACGKKRTAGGYGWEKVPPVKK